MIIVNYPCYNCIDRKLKYMCGYIDNDMSLLSLYQTRSLIQDGYGFLVIDMSCHLIMGSHHWENDVLNKTQTINVAYDRIKFIAIISACQVSVPMTMRSCNPLTPGEYLVCIKHRNVTE